MMVHHYGLSKVLSTAFHTDIRNLGCFLFLKMKKECNKVSISTFEKKKSITKSDHFLSSEIRFEELSRSLTWTLVVKKVLVEYNISRMQHCGIYHNCSLYTGKELGYKLIKINYLLILWFFYWSRFILSLLIYSYARFLLNDYFHMTLLWWCTCFYPLVVLLIN